ncbi:hypothetical protein V6Z11_A03G059500 [Gossypium hirsutum]
MRKLVLVPTSMHKSYKQKINETESCFLRTMILLLENKSFPQDFVKNLGSEIIYQFRDINAKKVNSSKFNSFRLYALDDIGTRQFCWRLFIFFLLIKNRTDFLLRTELIPSINP